MAEPPFPSDLVSVSDFHKRWGHVNCWTRLGITSPRPSTVGYRKNAAPSKGHIYLAQLHRHNNIDIISGTKEIELHALGSNDDEYLRAFEISFTSTRFRADPMNNWARDES